jgi:hypothetical protein
VIACFARAERVVALYFSVRSAFVVMRLGARSMPRAQQPQKFPFIFCGSSPDPSAARRKKLQGNFWFARHYDLSKSSFKSPST